MDIDTDSYSFHTDSVYYSSTKRGFNFDVDMVQGFGAESQKKRHDISSSFNASQLPQSTPNRSNGNQGEIVVQIGRRSTQSGTVPNNSVHMDSKFSTRTQANVGSGTSGRDKYSDKTNDEELHENGISTNDFYDEEDSNTRQSRFENYGFLRPVTVKQMLNAPNTFTSTKKGNLQFKIEGRDIDKVYAVAQIVKLEHYPKYVLFELEDGSAGRIKGKFFVESENRGEQQTKFNSTEVSEDVCEIRGCRHLDYICLIGCLDRYPITSTKNQLKIDCFQKVEDPHQIFHHLLNVMYVKVAQEKGEPPREKIEEIKRQRAATVHREAMDNTSTQYRTQPETPQTPRTPQKASMLPIIPTTPATPTPSRRQSNNPFEDLSSMGLNSPSVNKSAQMEGSKFRPSNSVMPQTSTPKRKTRRVFSRSSDTDMDDDADKSLGTDKVNESNKKEAGVSGDSNATMKSPRVFPRMDHLPSSSHNVTNKSPQTSEKPTTTYSSSEKQKGKQLDPYSHLTRLERQIILFILDRQMRNSSERDDDYDDDVKFPGTLEEAEKVKQRRRRGPRNVYPVDRDRGVHVEDIANDIMTSVASKNISPLTIDEAIQHLYEEGYIYCTIDEMHYNVNDGW